MSEYSMPSYFQTMPVIGKELVSFHEDNAAEIQAVEQEIHEIREAALEAGKSTEALNESGQWTAMQRIMELVDEGTWCPLNSLYNPEDNKNGSVGIVKGLGRIDGKWAVIIASDNKKLAGAWVPGQADSLLRGSDTAKRLRIPLVYVLNCSGVKLDEQEKVYPNRRGGGTPFYRNSELNQMGVPVIVGIYGTNPAGGGYHSISPTILIAHQDANMAVGGAGIVGGMSPKGHVDKEAAEALIQAQKNLKSDIPGTVSIHYGETGFFREVYADEEGVLAGIRKYMDMLPAYDPEFFRVDDPKEPLFDANDLYSIVPFNQKRSYDMVEVMARLFDGSEFMEYKHGYGPEMITGLAKIDDNFTLLYISVSKRKLSTLLKSAECRLYLSMVLGCAAFIAFELMWKNDYALEPAVRSSLFHVVSFITSTGLLADDPAKWAHVTWVVLAVCMFLGPCSGSTGGGFKCIRGVMLLKVIKNEFRQMLHPNAVLPVKIDGVNVPQSKRVTLLAFLTSYLILCLICSFSMIAMGIDNTNAITITLSTLGNVGPTLGLEIGPTMSWSILPDMAKWICSILMLIGRLEIFTVLVIFTPQFWKEN